MHFYGFESGESLRKAKQFISCKISKYLTVLSVVNRTASPSLLCTSVYKHVWCTEARAYPWSTPCKISTSIDAYECCLDISSSIQHQHYTQLISDLQSNQNSKSEVCLQNHTATANNLLLEQFWAIYQKHFCLNMWTAMSSLKVDYQPGEIVKMLK